VDLVKIRQLHRLLILRPLVCIIPRTAHGIVRGEPGVRYKEFVVWLLQSESRLENECAQEAWIDCLHTRYMSHAIALQKPPEFR
jgi:hypothetical protein